MKSRQASGVLIMLLGAVLIISCELNIFRDFEHPPFYDESELYGPLSEIRDDAGYLNFEDMVIIIETLEGSGNIAVHPLIVTFISHVQDMIKFDTIDRFALEGGDFGSLATNLETTLDAILDAVGMGLPDISEITTYVEVRGFTASIQEIFGEDTPMDGIIGVREMTQRCAAAAAQIRLMSNGNARAVVEESADILLRIFGAAGGPSDPEPYYSPDTPEMDPPYTKGSRTWEVGPETYEHLAAAYKFVFNMDDGRQFVLALIQESEEYTAIRLLLAGEDGLIEIDDPATVFEIPPFPEEPDDPESYDTAEEEILAQQVTDSLTLGGLFRLADTFLMETDNTTNLLEVLGYVLTVLTEHLDGFEGVDLGSADLNEMFTIIKDNFSADEIDSMIGTFDALADTSRAFFGTMTLEEEGGVSAIAPDYLEFDGSLNALGLDMAIYALMSLPVDYFFRVSDQDPVGFLNLDPFMDFLTADDAIVVTMDESYENPMGEEKDLMTVEFNYLGDILSPLIVELYISILREEGVVIEDYLLALTDSVSISHAFVDLDLLEKTLTVLNLESSTSELFDQAHAWLTTY